MWVFTIFLNLVENLINLDFIRFFYLIHIVNENFHHIISIKLKFDNVAYELAALSLCFDAATYFFLKKQGV